MATLTVADYLARMKQAIGNADPSTGFTLLQVLNESVRALFDYTDWEWRKRPPAFCSLVANQQYVDLPSDFGSNGILQTVHSIWSPTTYVNKVSLADIARYRGQPVQNHLNYFLALATPSQVSSTVRLTVPRLEIWPTPAADIPNAFRITYKAGAIELSSNTDVPNIPAGYEQMLTHLARARIQFYEYGPTSPEAAAELSLADREFANLSAADGNQEEDAGPIRGGAAAPYLNGNSYPFRPFSTFPTR